jgi:hypothetical protein
MKHDIPAHILVQVHVLAADGLPVERISFTLRLDKEVIEEELRNPTIKVETTREESPAIAYRE